MGWRVNAVTDYAVSIKWHWNQYLALWNPKICECF
jgi:hypothetical protein